MESVRILKDIMLHGVLLSWDNKRESLLCNYWVVQKVCGKNHTKKWSKTVKEVEKTGCVVNTACSSFGMKLA